MFHRLLRPSLVVSALLVAAPALADQLSVTVRATADAPAPGDTMPTTLVEPEDVAETPEPICTVCAIITKSKESSAAATIRIPSADAFVGDVELIVALDDGRQVSGRITGVAIDPSRPRTIALTSGDDWRWDDVRVVWTKRHRTATLPRVQPEATWDGAGAVGARAAMVGDTSVDVDATSELAGDLTLVIVSDSDPKTGRPARATATLDGIELGAGDDLAIQISTAWAFDWDGVRAAWIELRTEPQTAAGDMKPEYKYISIRRF